MNSVYVLHIGKTAGSALKFVLRKKLKEFEPDGVKVELCGHRVTLRRVFEDEQSENPLVLFFLRDPVSRFRSGFNSRLRKGRPRYNSEWTADEEIAFDTFHSPDQLAAALSAEDDSLRASAEFALKSIKHVRHPFSRWLVSPEYLDQHVDRIFHIGFQETFDQDVKSILRKLGLDDSLPEMDELTRHATPSGFDTSLSERAIDNLRKWYADDYEIYDWCLKHHARINARELPALTSAFASSGA